MTPFVLTETDLGGLSSGDTATLSTDVDRHVRHVVRVQNGDDIVVTDGAGHVTEAVLTKNGLRLMAEVRTVAPRTPGITVLQAIGKGRKHDEVVRVCTELGVERIVAVSAEQSITVLRDDKVDRVRRRWHAVADSAVQQSHNPWAPELLGPVGIERAVEELPDGATLLIADIGDDVGDLREAVGDAGHIAIAIGPESGWTDDERNLWRLLGATSIGLGPTVLRTEHAAAVAVAAVGAVAGRWVKD